MQDVLGVLDTAEDSKEVMASLANNDEWDDGDDGDDGDEKNIKNMLRVKSTLAGDDEEDNGKSPLRQAKDYSDHSGQLHQHHRGLMQWKVRTDSLKHHDRNPGIETEV